jgi:hypothetical protein
MLARRPFTRCALAGAFSVALSFSAVADTKIQPLNNAGPVFGLADDAGSLLVADAGAGIVRLRNKKTELVAALPGISDVAPVNPFTQLAITGGGPGPTAAKLYRVVKGVVTQVADLGAFEATVNPDAPEINPNPFDLVALPGGAALVADAGGNSLLYVDKNGVIDWVATLPNQLVSTANVKVLFNCPAGPPNICGLPSMIPAQPVATSVAIGPDGAYYVGELKGFPAPTGASRVWRIEPAARHARCGISPDCSIVAGGFTSIVDLGFDRKGTLYVNELDEASWFAVEVTGNPIGGTVNACRLSTDTGQYDDCQIVATGIPTPLAITIDEGGHLHYLSNGLEPGAAEVVSVK